MVGLLPSAASPLSERHAAAGATWVELEGTRAVARFGPLADEHAALSAGGALVDCSWTEALVMTGEDRRRFLNGLLTCDVGALERERSVYGFATDLQGRILADVTVLEHDQSFWLELPPGRGEAMAAHFGKYLIADRVEIAPVRDMVALALVGEAGQSAVAVSEEGLEPGGVRGTTLEGVEVVARRGPWWGLDALLFWVPREAAASLWQRLERRGVVPVGLEALEIARVERGRPRFGADFGPETFPQETGLVEEAVSFSKGCYLGQEVVARIHYRGQIQRGLVGLRFEGEEPPPRGTSLELDGRAVGTVTSAVRSLRHGFPLGLGMVHRRGRDPGARLEVSGAGGAEVVALPLG